MANTKLYRKGVTILLALAEAIPNPLAPTTTILNTRVSTLSAVNNGTLVFNVTCASWEDGTTFELGDPDTDDGLTFCDDAGFSAPTIDNPSVVMEFIMDADIAATGQYNLAKALVMAPGLNYYAILRVGKDSNQAFAVGDYINIVAVQTDNPVLTYDESSPVRITQNFLSNGFSHPQWAYPLAA